MPNSSERRENANDDEQPSTGEQVPETVSVGWPVPGRRVISIPKTIRDVKIGEEIGRGGMGIVYRGWHAVLDRPVAVKVLLGVSARKGDPQFDRFFGGARAEATVKHPRIVSVHDAGQVEGIPYVVMEYIDGPSLRALTETAGRLPLSVATKVIWDVVEAVDALHERDIIHRDLKPGNVLVDREGHVFVTDFGLASLTRRVNDHGSAAGTPVYMAPESFEGKGSPQSDVYAMGIMLFELLSGRLPFSGDLPVVRDQHANVPLPVDQLPDSIPPEMVDIVLQATHKKEMFRYKNAGRFLSALRASVATDELLTSGATRLRAMVFDLYDREQIEHPTEHTKDTTKSTCVEHLAELVERKRTACETRVRAEGRLGDRVVSTEAGIPTSEHDATDIAKSAYSRSREHPCSLAARGRRAKSSDPRDTLKLLRCPKCDYDLVGLPRRHRCPECGFEYDESMFLLYGWTRHERRSLAGRWTRPVSWLARAWVGFVVGLLVLIVISNVYSSWTSGTLTNLRDMLGLAFAVLIIADILWRTFRFSRLRERSAGTIQLLFSSEGTSEQRGIRSPKSISWQRFRKFRFRRVGPGVWRLRLRYGVWPCGGAMEAIIECTRREAALIRGEIRRRLQGSCFHRKVVRSPTPRRTPL